MADLLGSLFSFKSKYGYNNTEMILMAIITALTNFNGIPGVLINHKRKCAHSTFVGAFVTICSFMYHFCESLGIRIILNEGEWHRLDNVGAICGIVSLKI